MPVGRRYRVECSCGWTSVWLDNIDDAKRAQINHEPLNHKTFVLCELAPEPETTS